MTPPIESGGLRFLYATRERYPTFRVDLTELFSAGMAGKGHRIDWHMLSNSAATASVKTINPNERVFVGAAVDPQRPSGRLINQLAALWHDLGIYTLVRRVDYDFVQVRDKVFAGLVMLLATRSRQIPFFFVMSFPYPEADLFRAQDRMMDLSWPRRLFYRLRGRVTDALLYKVILPRADHVFVISEQMRKDVAARGIAPRRMTPLPMGINLDQVADASPDEVCDARLTGKLPLVYVGTLVRVRRIDFLIDMLKQVRQSLAEAVLVLVGDAPKADMQFLRDHARENGLHGQVIFTGFIPTVQAWAYIRAARVCLSPFRPSPILRSASPTKLIEYLAWGRPAVANDHPDQTKVLAESGGGVAVDYDPNAFADAVVGLLRDPARAREMGRLGQAYVRDHRSYAVLSRQLEQKYLELLSLDVAP